MLLAGPVGSSVSLVLDSMFGTFEKWTVRLSPAMVVSQLYPISLCIIGSMPAYEVGAALLGYDSARAKC